MLDLQQRLLSPVVVAMPAEKDTPFRTERTSIGSRVLDEDRRAENVPNTIFERLDSVVSEVERVVTVSNVTTIDEARAVLMEIEGVITSSNFVCSQPAYLVHSFSQGLLPRELDRRLITVEQNRLRRTHIIANEDELFSHVDCDLGNPWYKKRGHLTLAPGPCRRPIG